jgi:molecular chaperone GrpE (heat shock protein)
MPETPHDDPVWRPDEDDDIEILEVVGMDDDAPPSDPHEIDVTFDVPAPARPDRAGAAVEEGGVAKEQLNRLRADFENLKKRMERERDEYYRHATGGLILRLLAVLDNLERALAAGRGGGGEEGFRRGVALIHRQLYDELCKEGLTAVDAVGESFDPAVHEAVATDTSAELPANTVVEELQRGYYFQDRLLRPALVRVSVGPEVAAPSSTREET